MSMFLPAGLYVVVKTANLFVPLLVSDETRIDALFVALKKKIGFFHAEVFKLQYRDRDRRYKWVCNRSTVMQLTMDVSGVLYVYMRPFVFPKNFRLDLLDPLTMTIYFHHLQDIVDRGGMDMTIEIAHNLRALELQKQYGDFRDGIFIPSLMESIGLPPQNLVGNYYIDGRSWIDSVTRAWRTKKGMTPRQAVKEYITVIAKLPKYGVTYFKIWDEDNREKYVGLCLDNFSLYDPDEMSFCEMEIPWPDILIVKSSGRKITIKRLNPAPTKLHIFVEDTKEAEQLQYLCEEYKKMNRIKEQAHNPTYQNRTARRTGGNTIVDRERLWEKAVKLHNGRKKCSNSHERPFCYVYMKPFKKQIGALFVRQ